MTRFLRGVAVVPLIVGTIILLACYVTSNSLWALAGMWFLFVAVPLNILALILTLLTMLFGKRDQDTPSGLPLTLALLVANYPIAFGYGWVGMRLMSTSYVSVINNSGRDIQRASLVVRRQVERELGDIRPGKKVSASIMAKGDGSVTLSFQAGGETRECTVIGYVCRGISRTATVEIADNLECKVSVAGIDK